MSDFNPYAAPDADDLRAPSASATDASGPWCRGRVLVMSKTGDLPPRCVCCNAPAAGKPLRRTLAWHTPWLYALAFFNLFLYLVVALAIRKTVTIRVGLCDRHRGRRRMWIAIAWSLVLLAIVLPMLAGAFLPQAAVVFALLSPLMVLVAGVIGIYGARVVYAKSIDNRYVWIGGVSPAFLKELPYWDGTSSAG